MKAAHLPTIFSKLRFPERDCLRGVPDLQNPFPELRSKDGELFSMKSLAAGTSATNAKRSDIVVEVVERFVDHSTDWSLTVDQHIDQVVGIAATIRNFLAEAAGEDGDEPVLIGLYETGLSDEALVQSLFHGQVKQAPESKRKFGGRLSSELLGRSFRFDIDQRIHWSSPFHEDRFSLPAYSEDCDWMTVGRRVEDPQTGRRVWRERRVYPVARYGQSKGKPVPRFTRPLVRTEQGSILVADNSIGRVLDKHGLFDGSVLRITVFSGVTWPTLTVVPNCSLHIQLTRTGLVASIGCFTGFFGYFSKDVTKLLEVFRAGGAE